MLVFLHHYFTWSWIPHGHEAFNRFVSVLWKDQHLLGDFFWFVESNLLSLVLLQRRMLLMDYCLFNSFSLWPSISGKRITQEEAPLPDSILYPYSATELEKLIAGSIWLLPWKSCSHHQSCGHLEKALIYDLKKEKQILFFLIFC